MNWNYILLSLVFIIMSMMHLAHQQVYKFAAFIPRDSLQFVNLNHSLYSALEIVSQRSIEEETGISLELHDNFPDELLNNETRSNEIREELLNTPNLVSLIGAYASHSTFILSKLMDDTNLPILTYASTAVSLSTHTNIIRFVASDIVEIHSIMDFLFVANLNDIFIIHSNTVYGQSGANSSTTEAEARGIRVIGKYGIDHPQNDFEKAFQSAKDSNAKTIVNILSFGSFPFNTTEYFSIAKSYGLMDKGYFWFFSQTFDHVVKNFFPSDSQLRELSKGIFMIAQQNTRWSFKSTYYRLMNRRVYGYEFPINPELVSKLTLYDAFLYDSVITLYETLVKIKKENQDLSNLINLRNNLKKYHSIGASGTITFDENGDRLGIVTRIVNIGLDGEQNDMASYSLEEGIHNMRNLNSKNSTIEIYIVGTNEKFKLPILMETPEPSGSKYISIPLFGDSPTERFGYCAKVMKDMIIVYGGKTSTGYMEDIYVYNFDAARWRYISPLSKFIPDGREGCLCEVQDNNLYFLHGRDDYYILDDFNLFNLEAQTYQNIGVLTPIPRYNGGMINRNKKLIIFGGATSIGFVNDMWEFDLDNVHDKWIEIKYIGTERPPPMESFSFEYLSSYDCLYIFGGTDDLINGFKDLWKFNFTNLQWSKINTTSSGLKVPNARFSAGMTSYDSTLYLGLGWDTEFPGIPTEDDLWTIDISKPEPKWEFVTKFVGMQKRDSIPLLRWHDQLIIFGGQFIFIPYNDFFTYDIVSNQLRQVHPNYFSPQPITDTTAVRISSKMIIWGGVTVLGKPLSAHITYSLDLETLVWTQLTIKNEPPNARNSHTAIAVGDRMFIFGGKSGGNVFHDLWVFSLDLAKNEGTWNEIIPKNNIFPPPRSDHSSFYDGQHVYVTHGVYQVPQVDFWSFDIELEAWESKTVTGGGSSHPLIHCGTAFLPKFRSAYYIGCSFPGGGIRPHLYKYEVDKQTFSVFMSGMSFFQYFTVSQSLIDVVRDDSIVIFGGHEEGFVSNSIKIINVDTQKVYPIQPLNYYFPDARSLAMGVYYLNKLFIFGGTSSLHGAKKLVRSLIVGDCWVIDLTPVYHDNYVPVIDSIPPIYCSPGSKEFRGVCIPCEKGTYRDSFSVNQTQCTPCPPGEYSNAIGANSRSLCRPCEAGKYSPSYGAFECLPCPDKKYCPISCITPLDSNPNIYQTSSPSITQPKKFSPNLFVNQILTYALLTTAGLAASLLAISLLCLWKLKILKLKFLLFFDKMFTTSHHTNFGIMRKKQTVVGALFTITATCVVIMYFTAFTIDYFNGGNIEEFMTVLPIFTLNQKIFPLRNISINVEAFTYRGKCVNSENVKNTWTTCTPEIKVHLTGLVQKTDQPYYRQLCYLDVSKDSNRVSNCKISWFCENCVKSTKSEILFEFEESESFASAISYNVKTYSGYDLETYSEISHSIVSNDGYLFRGRIPTTITLNSFNTQFNETYTYLGIRNRHFRNYGYHIDFQDISIGSQVNHQTFHHASGMKIQFNIEDQHFVLNVERKEKRELSRFITETLAACAGIIAFIRLIMSGIEHIVDGFKFNNALPIDQQERIHEFGFIINISKLVINKLLKPLKKKKKGKYNIKQEELDEFNNYDEDALLKNEDEGEEDSQNFEEYDKMFLVKENKEY